MVNQDTIKYLRNAQISNKIRQHLAFLLPLLSVLVVIAVFWWLKLTGITMAGDAFCGITEHAHSEECTVSTLTCSVEQEPDGHVHADECYEVSYSCGRGEHIHTVECYSDITADVETADIWEETLKDIPANLITSEKIVAVAESQIGYRESIINYIVDSEGTKFGYTRYGEWYGNPYGNWSTMFTCFCLRYGGNTDVPISGGAETMRLLWEEEGLYKLKYEHLATAGDIVFLDKNSNGTVDATAVVTGLSDGVLYVIEGDLDDTVAEAAYAMSEETVVGFGISAGKSSPILMAAPLTEGGQTIANTVTYTSAMLNADNSFILYTYGSDGNCYAIDGNSNAVRIYIDTNGNVTSDVSDPNLLYWTFEYCGTYENQSTYYISNVATGKYLHPYADSNTNHGAILSGRWESAVYSSGSGVKFRGARQNAYAYLQNNSTFTNTGTLNAGTTFYFAKSPTKCSVWFDGTLGGLMSYSGSPNTKYTVDSGSKLKLPEQWQSPEKYEYKLIGWYDVVNNKYYAPGAEITVAENMVFYADWVAASYDIGQYNAATSNTVSTNDFITTHVFDYSPLFNVQSSYASVTANASGHTETWNFIANGVSPYTGEPTLDFIFRDWDQNSDISYPVNHNSKNTNGSIYAGLYTPELGDVLFSTENSFDPQTGTGVIGKQYLGEGDHLFQLMTDPTDEHYGYYYYDSSKNAAAYNQSDERFYVYDYLERTSDSANSSSGKYSDFLPLNSPYVNTNGKNVVTYTYNGDNGEYPGVNHCQYDAKYNSNGSSTANVATNYMFGMAIDVKFYLPTVPGTLDSDGNYGNRDVYGKEMHFKFSGDDDVWVLVDGQVVLDIGGIHGIESGDVNFSTGVVTVNGEYSHTLSGIGEGDHVLTIYYLERGSSQSNCQLYFNLAPRFALSIQKEDVLTQEVLNGAEFSVYTDKECTVPAKLWTDKASYDAGEPSQNTFTVTDGIANLWGFGAGNTYYIRETKPPDNPDYSIAYGIISLSFDKSGAASYSVEIINETDEDGNVINTSNGFTVHGFRIDEETQQAFIVVTNAEDWVRETTTVQATKKWNDSLDHTYDKVTAYLTVTDPDGTVRRIREIELSEENNWTYTWTNIPRYAEDGITEIVYGVEEAYVSGYSPTIEQLEEITVTNVTWAEALEFKNGEVYILGTSSGYLSTQSSTSSGFMWVSEEVAKESPLALWTATVSSGNVRLTNKAGQILSLNYNYSSSSRYFYATTGGASSQNMIPVDAGNGLRLYSTYWSRNYYFCALNSSGTAQTSTTQSSGLVFVPMTRVTETITQKLDNFAFLITNTPLEEETAVRVNKLWDTGMATGIEYERSQVTVKLYANGKDTGRTVTLSLKNGWTDTFLGLPYSDAEGNVIEYSVVESWDNPDWTPKYSEVTRIEGEIPTYSVTVTNRYNWGNGYELPATGGYGPTPWILSGLALMAVALVSGYVLRHRRRKEERE